MKLEEFPLGIASLNSLVTFGICNRAGGVHYVPLPRTAREKRCATSPREVTLQVI